MKQWSVDPKSYELAEYFAQGENFSEEELKQLSQQIQDVCEDFSRSRSLPARENDGLCSDCPPARYPSEKTRCADCPRRKGRS